MSKDGGYLLLDAIQDPTEASFQVEPGTGKPYMSYMSKYRNTVRLITLIHDHNVGEVNWKNGVKEVKYFVDDGDFEIMKAGLKTNARILFAAGAKQLYIPTSQKLTIDSEDQIDAVIDGLNNEPARYRYTSFHPQGTCRMGADPKTTVVSPTGETHEVKNLYIVDASILPTSTGYNPVETVYALAHYISDQINRAHA
jgi:choline dehydrogenase-like flavoprotein